MTYLSLFQCFALLPDEMLLRNQESGVVRSAQVWRQSNIVNEPYCQISKTREEYGRVERTRIVSTRYRFTLFVEV